MIEKPKEIFRPERPATAAAENKAREVHGNSANAYGYNKGKRDGQLMSATGDWKNAASKINNSGNSPMKNRNNRDGDVDARGKKHQNL